MQAAVLDTLRCAQTLKTAGFTPEQAEATARVLGDALSDVATKADVNRLEAKIDAKFDAMDQKFGAKFEAMNAKFEAMDQKFEAMDQKFEAMDQKFEAMDQKFEAMDKKFEAMDKKFEAMNEKFETKFEAMQSTTQEKFDRVDKSLNDLDRNLKIFLGLVSVLLVAVLGFFGAVATPYLLRDGPEALPNTPQSAATAQAHTAPPEPLAEAHPATTPTPPHPPKQDAPSGRVQGRDIP